MRIVNLLVGTGLATAIAMFPFADAFAQLPETQKRRLSGGVQRPVAPGSRDSTATPLTISECYRLRCAVFWDETCPLIGLAQLRCECEGGGNACIDERDPRK